MIVEPFTLLPCPAKRAERESTIGMEGCEEHALVKTDRKIDALAGSVFHKLFDAPARRRFVAAERAWLAYRRAYCTSRSDLFEGGSGAPVIFAGCSVDLNEQHIRDLTQFVKDLSH